jgi:hypothetical protein
MESRLAALLADPQMWDEPDPDAEESIVAAVVAAAAAQRPAPAREVDAVDGDNRDNVVAISAARRWIAPFLAGAAAVLLVVAAVTIVQSDLGGSDEVADAVTVTMEGTPEAPDASAVADILDTPLGTRIDFAVVGLPPAPAGTYYEAWLRQSPEVGVSAGTFHLRGGDGTIELWAGVGLDEYPLVTVTLQQEGGGAASSGVVVLRGSAG